MVYWIEGARIMRQLLIFILLSCLVLPVHADTDEIFPLPPLLEPNVTFWKKIYTEVSVTEGLLHDRDYPALVYQKVHVGKRTGRRRSNYLDPIRDEFERKVRIVISEPEDAWPEDVKEIGAKFLEHVPRQEWTGAENRIRFQQGQKERFLEGIMRSGAYLDTIRSVFREYQIPQRIAFLPHVESSFNPYAYSKVGAAGLWQFMRSTGRMYMEINYVIDERRDPFLSTIAAAKLLSHNYKQLGTWPLAITAYNHGVNGMRRAIRSTGSTDIGVIIEKHSSRSFRFASKNFYGCFLAASEIAANVSEYFPEIQLAPRLHVSEIELDHYVRPSVLSSYLNVSQDALEALNPALRRVVFTSDKMIPKGYRLRLPSHVTSTVAKVALATIPDSLRSNEPERQQYYRVQRGDNLYAIASRLGVSARDIAAENNIDRIHRIYAGQVLRIPGATASPAVKKTEEAVASAKPAKKAPAKATVVLAEASQPEEAETEEDKSPREVVARNASTEESSKKNLESADPAPAEQDMKEVLAMPALADPQPVVSRGQGEAFDVEIYGLDVTLTGTGGTAQIRVTVDETMGHFAEWLDIPTQRIRNLNGMGRSSGIRIGQKLLIPVDADDLDRFVEARLEYHMALEEDFYAQYKVVDTKSRILRRGENLWGICNGEEQLPLWLFKKHNKHLNLASLVAGTEIFIPQVEEKTEEEMLAETSIPEPLPVFPYVRESLHPENIPVQLVP